VRHPRCRPIAEKRDIMTNAASSAEQIGFIGIGFMGHGMA
jgi:hypothetical protein